MSSPVLYTSMSLDGFIAGPNDEPGNPGGDSFMRLHDWLDSSSDSGRTHGDASELIGMAEAKAAAGAKKRDGAWRLRAKQALDGGVDEFDGLRDPAAPN